MKRGLVYACAATVVTLCAAACGDGPAPAGEKRGTHESTMRRARNKCVSNTPQSDTSDLRGAELRR